MHALPINARLQDGKLAVSKPLGQGGFGITYFGGDVQLRRYVAIKELFPQGSVRQANVVQSGGAMNAADFAAAKKKFLEEARVLAQFRHPGIVQVYGCFEENETAYIVMEFLKGVTLAQLVEERGALPEKEAVAIIEKAAQALEEVHRAGLLHRDIKPENIMVCDDERVVLIDFGLTKKVEEAVGLGTRPLSTTTRFGSDGYAPPEQYLKSGVLGTHTDVYALGATLYFLLTGKTPLSAMERAMGEDFEEPKSVNGGISAPVNDAIVKAMAVRADERLQTVSDFIGRLQVKTSILTSSLTEAENDEPDDPQAKTQKLHDSSTGVATNVTPINPNITAASWLQFGVKRPVEITVFDTASLYESIEKARPETIIRLSGSSYELHKPLIIRKSLHLVSESWCKARIECFAEGFVVSFEGNCKWTVQDIIFHHCGTSWGNVVEVNGGAIEFQQCQFMGGVTDYTKGVFSPRCWAGNGLRIRENTAKATVVECGFFDNGSCGIEYSPNVPTNLKDNIYKTNKVCTVCSGDSR